MVYASASVITSVTNTTSQNTGLVRRGRRHASAMPKTTTASKNSVSMSARTRAPGTNIASAPAAMTGVPSDARIAVAPPRRSRFPRTSGMMRRR